jgi:hypothetical protein
VRAAILTAFEHSLERESLLAECIVRAPPVAAGHGACALEQRDLINIPLAGSDVMPIRHEANLVRRDTPRDQCQRAIAASVPEGAHERRDPIVVQFAQSVQQGLESALILVGPTLDRERVKNVVERNRPAKQVALAQRLSRKITQGYLDGPADGRSLRLDATEASAPRFSESSGIKDSQCLTQHCVSNSESLT